MNSNEPIINEASEPVDGQPSTYRRAIIVSIFAHVVLFGALLFWYLPGRNQGKTAAAPASTGSDESATSKKPLPPKPVKDIPAEQIQESIESQIEQVKKLPDEKKLSELEKNLRRLDSIASEESVKGVTNRIASTLGLDQDQYRPNKKPAAGEFDAESAQLQDVTRKRSESGGWEYESVLVDAEGRTMTVPMAAGDGETVYNTFQQMKKFPMAEGIYRSVVMPLLQKMLD